MPPKKALEHASFYTVGWIAALAHERAAALMLLDERHERPSDFVKNESDQNSYSWGQIGAHKIVIASLPAGKYGLVSAADTASGLRASLPHIRIGLLVGIGAGIPGEHIKPDGQIALKRNILLGDVVVGIPDGTNGGVVQYDLYKAKGEAGGFERKGFLNAAPGALLGAVAALQAEHEIGASQLNTFLEVFKSNAKTRTQYGYPGSAKDHIRAYLQTKATGEVRMEVAIHYGTIISGNTLVKSAVDRDVIVTQLELENIRPLCLEMEAAGMMNSFPCIVIRGVCDYADEHKNDEWQRYAAATAAAYAKELLTYVDPAEIKKERALGEVLDNIYIAVHQVKSDTTQLRNIVTSSETEARLRWICPVDYAQIYDTYSKACVQNTGQWLLEHKKFQHWLSEGRVLYCPGSPGVGKTMLATRVIEYVYTTILRSRDMAMAYIYFDHARQGEQDLVHLLSCLLRQLSHAADHPELREALREVAREEFAQVYVVVDALDECELRTRLGLVTLLRSMAQTGNVKLMATSRLIPEIDDLFSEDVRLNLSADEQDISKYVRGRAIELQNILLFSHDVFESIVGTIVPAVQGMFLLARLHMDTLKSKTSPRDIVDSLQSLPDGYNGAYEAAMARVNNQDDGHRRLANRVLMWVVCAKRPLLANELHHAIAIRHGDKVLRTDGLIRIELLVAACAGLVALRDSSMEAKDGVKSGLVVHLAHYTTQEYFDRTRETWFSKAELLMSQSCLSYLTLHHFETEPCEDDAELESRLGQYPFFEYAAKCWGLHALTLEMEGNEDDWKVLLRAIAPFLHSTRLTDAAIQVQTLGAMRIAGHASRTPRKSTACHLFARSGLGKLCDHCHEIGIDVSIADSNGNSALFYALEYCPPISAENMLSWSQRTDLSKFGDMALWYAVRHQQHATITYLLKLEYIDPNSRLHSKTPLIWSAWSGHTETVRLLLDCPRVNINVVAEKAGSALLNAVKNQHWDAAKLLLDKEGIDTEALLSRFLDAARRGSLDFIRLLLDAPRFPVNFVDSLSRCALSYAAEHGREWVVEMLLVASGVTVDLADQDGNTPLFWAVMHNRGAVVRQLLDVGRADVNTVGRVRHEGKLIASPLLVTAVLGQLDAIVDAILSKENVLVDRPDELGCTALYYACRNGNSNTVKALIGSHNANIHWRTPFDQTPWTIAALKGYPAIIRILIESDVSLLNSRDRNECTALFHAAQLGHIKVLGLIPGYQGADINATNTAGETALIAAARTGMDDSTHALLKQDGVDVNVRDVEGRTAFWHACHRSGPSPVKLLGHHEDVAVTLYDHNGQTLLVSTAAQDRKDMTRFLLADSAIDVDVQGWTGANPLSYAHQCSGASTALILCGHDAIDVNMADNEGCSPLMAATKAQNYGLVSSLLRLPGINIGAKDESGRTALWFACDTQQLNIALLLAESHPFSLHVCDTKGYSPFLRLLRTKNPLILQLCLTLDPSLIHRRNRFGNTALHVAALSGYNEATMWLLSCERIDVSARNEVGQTPLHLAALEGHTAVVKTLLATSAMNLNAETQNQVAAFISRSKKRSLGNNQLPYGGRVEHGRSARH
ncbi:Ankyrin-3 [Pseudocercospora fuligena]|uniref:Ankyrin-3 n=1 Tax=Pseudocercospora fuligena TaxID=685502 RepID=A0A8H6R909_9PEZI|nr:Ankyrin-3 [Pseudocercospora fuligena]